MSNRENSGEHQEDGDSSDYLELEDLPESSVDKHSSGQVGETIPGTVSGVDISTPTRELRKSSGEL